MCSLSAFRRWIELHLAGHRKTKQKKCIFCQNRKIEQKIQLTGKSWAFHGIDYFFVLVSRKRKSNVFLIVFFMVNINKETASSAKANKTKLFPAVFATFVFLILFFQSCSSSIKVSWSWCIVDKAPPPCCSQRWSHGCEWRSPAWTLPSMIGQSPLFQALSLVKINSRFWLIIPCLCIGLTLNLS